MKPAGVGVGPAIRAADQALASGSVDQVAHSLTEKVAAGVRVRFAAAADKKKRAAESVAAGREYVRAYVEFIHYVEQVDAAAGRAAAHPPEAHHH